MDFVLTTIVSLISFIIAFNSSNLVEAKQQKSVKSIALLIGTLCALASVYHLLFRFLIIVPAGKVAVVETFGKVAERPLEPGVNLINPLSQTIDFSTRLKDIKETVSATSSEGLNLDLDVSLQYKIDSQKAGEVYKNIGVDEEEILISRFRSIIRQITATYEAKDVYGEKRQEIASRLRQELRQQLNPLGFIVEETLLRKVILPPKIQAAIQQKIEAEQDSQRQEFINRKKRQELEFELEKATKEAERKKIEAQGIAEAQKLISQNLSASILELKAIEATQELATSPNAKTIIVGRSKDGLPLILQK